MRRLPSSVVPAPNEPRYFDEAMHAIGAALDAGALADTEVTLADDGSDDGTADIGVTACSNGLFTLSLSVLSRTRSGRFSTRLAGITTSTGRLVLVVDSPVEVDPSSNASEFIAGRWREWFHGLRRVW